MKRFTIASSPEWKATTTSRPPGRRRVLRRLQRAGELAQLVVHRHPERLEGEGRGIAAVAPPLHPGDQRGQRVGGRDRRLRPLGRYALRDPPGRRLVAELAQQPRQLRLAQRVHEVGGARPSRLIRMSSGPAARNENPRAGSSSWKEDMPRSSAIPSTDASPSEASPSRICPNGASTTASRPGLLRRRHRPRPRRGVGVAVERDDPAAGRRQQQPGVAAAAEGGVDVDAAVPGLEGGHGGVGEHGHVRHVPASSGRIRLLGR
jgi:hypothetical protein